jgi:RHS repeat-associated protein
VGQPGSGPAPQYSFNSNNQISGSGVQYDAAGNMTNDGLGNTYTYDAEGRVISVSGNNSASYVYDAMGQRVRTTVNGSSYDFIFEGGHAVDEVTASNWAWGDAGGLGIAAYANSTTYFNSSDWLGTARVWSNVSGGSSGTCTSLPFGDAQNCTGTMPVPMHYTGQPLDSETNLNHFLYRQLSTMEGRWTTPDPAGMAAVDPTNPQTWNRYAYVMNSPLSSTDGLGLVAGGDCGGPCVPFVQSFGGGCFQSISYTTIVASDGLKYDWPIFGPIVCTGGGGPQVPTSFPTVFGGGGGGDAFTFDCPAAGGISKWIPHGLTYGVTGNASLGVPGVGAMADGSTGGGTFISQAGQVSEGAFASGGASAFAGSHNASAPQQSKISPFVLGAYVGGGTFVSLTNAQSMNQLSGPFAQWNANIGFAAGYSLTFQYDNKSGIWNLSISQGPGIGLSGTAMTTTTGVKTNPGTCY